MERRIEQILAAYHNAATLIDSIPERYMPSAAKAIIGLAFVRHFIQGISLTKVKHEFQEKICGRSWLFR